MATKQVKQKYPKLRAAFKRKWLKALRSGKFVQGYGRLRNDKNESTSDKLEVPTYCCLGVACEITGLKYHGFYGTPEQNIIDVMFVGEPQRDELSKSDDKGAFDVLMNMNDGPFGDGPHKKFTIIANWIEKNL